jgi:hypothetical protein
MQFTPIAALRRPTRRFALVLRRRRARRRLNRDLAMVTEQELAGLLGTLAMTRSDVFTGVKGNRRHRQLMGAMLGRFGIDREIACAYRWEDLVEAEAVCARCPNAGKCRRWLAWGRNNDAPNVFCRNAGRFTQMRLELGLPRAE